MSPRYRLRVLEAAQAAFDALPAGPKRELRALIADLLDTADDPHVLGAVFDIHPARRNWRLPFDDSRGVLTFGVDPMPTGRGLPQPERVDHPDWAPTVVVLRIEHHAG